MTDDDKALVARLRETRLFYKGDCSKEAADRIVELIDENNKLRRDHASAVAELGKTRVLLKGYKRSFKKARSALMGAA